ncbi:MAG TPA: 2-phospho-L-lactate guanylyltransferase [Candidatus Methanoculleus thermohydrogenotrophicum]|jgi:2-phospho-L-lactate guanylyltransferase|nr:2-phospho-L-lactate guanylyltransferase [Candidatus Methanoculleus thermohydrogenotrophicum]NLM81134.1 2-phospho-L-lactate guanylyltransferase [Candidatus Methanoculleus thermohydrogenotrophicum]HOB18771.1 2-phospho-L-lactate guanylyltransferase [Candidatus Methanoculleus thermohydrogenotrophicum]HPZ38830.1 2-phospho-L-lactate guanylyltransferase [Candidatus Methanoculleus thermohydrogenotrophicum]
MYFHALIPFKPVNPKTRLSCILSQEEREAFARTMLEDVIASVLKSGCSATLLCTHPFKHKDTLTAVRKEPLNEAINWALRQFHCPALIIMADLPLVTAGDIQRLVCTEKDMAIVPGRGGGTNLIFLKKPQCFHADFYGASFIDHMAVAEECGFSVDVIDSFRMSTDIDEKEDLVEILIHGKGRKSKEFLESSGFTLAIDEKGRVGVQRNTHEETL